MLRIRTDGSIRVTRGDTAQIEVRAYGQDGDDFDLSQWSATMTVRVPDASGAVLFSKKAAAGTHPVVSISATDTAKVASGVYDIEAKLGNSTVTLVDATPFEIVEDVTR